jgi:hypothetical protein
MTKRATPSSMFGARRGRDDEAIGQGPKKTAKRERSTIEFPYNDLDNAVGIAKGIERAGGTACALDQLAAVLSVTVSGPFRQRVANAKTFGFIDTERGGQVRLTELGRAVADPSTGIIGASRGIPTCSTL